MFFLLRTNNLMLFLRTSNSKRGRLKSKLPMILQKNKGFKFLKSKRALAIPITYLILFVSTMLLISVTYAFAVQQVNSQKQAFQVVTAKQDMTSLDNDVLSVVSQPGSAATLDFRDSAGQLNIQPSSNNLTISITDNNGITATIFNAATGQVVYDLPSSTSPDLGFYLEGDSSTITNQSGSSLSQLYISNGFQGPQIQLGYRPAVAYSTAGIENGQAVTDIRIYIVNLNSSDPFALQGELPLKISCVSTQLTTETYHVSDASGSLAITSQLNGFTGSLSIPISSTSSGSIINVEIVTSNVSIDRGAV